MRKALFLRGVGLFLIMGGISLEIVMFSSAAGLDSTSTGFYVRIVLYACFASGLLVSIYGRYLFRQVMAQGHAVHHGGSGGGGGGGRTRAARVVLVGSVSPMLPM